MLSPKVNTSGCRVVYPQLKVSLSDSNTPAFDSKEERQDEETISQQHDVVTINEPARDTAIVGYVIDSQGLAVGSAKVTIFKMPSDFDWKLSPAYLIEEPKRLPVLETEASEAGYFIASPIDPFGLYMVRGFHEEAGSDSKQFIPAGGFTVLKLSIGAIIRGQIINAISRDLSASGVSSVHLSASGVRSVQMYDTTIATSTIDENCKYFIKDVPMGGVVIAFHSDKYTFQSKQLHVAPGHTYEVNFNALSSPSIFGKVIDKVSGQGIPDAQVTLQTDLFKTVTTDKDGLFTLNATGIEGDISFLLVASAEGYCSREFIVNDRRVENTLELSKALTLRGKVVERETGINLEDVDIWAKQCCSDAPTRCHIISKRARSSVDGSFVVTGFSTVDQILIQFRLSKHGSRQLLFFSGVDNESLLDRDLGTVTLALGSSVSGYITDENGNAVEEAKIHLTPCRVLGINGVGGRNLLEGGAYWHPSLAFALSDREGWFTLSDVDREIYTPSEIAGFLQPESFLCYSLKVSANGYQTLQKSFTLPIDQADEAVLNLKLSKSHVGIVNISMKDEWGKPIEDANINLAWLDGSAIGKTDAAGQLQLKWEKVMKVTLTAAKIGYEGVRAKFGNDDEATPVVISGRRSSDQIQFTPGDEAYLSISLKGLYHAGGKVDDSVLSCSSIILSRSGIILRKTAIQADRSFDFHEIPPGDYIIKCDSQDPNIIASFAIKDNSITDLLLHEIQH